MYLLILILILTLILVNTNLTETFVNHEYQRQILKYKPKDDAYMDFLSDLNSSFKENLDKATDLNGQITPIKQKVLCNDTIRKDIEIKSLKMAFDKIGTGKADCAYKSNHLCELTNPMLYLTETKNFPPRWIFKPYAKVALPKYTYLKCWNNLMNCCQTKISNQNS